MFGLPPEHLIPFANFIGLGLLGLVAFFGQRWGKVRPTPAEQEVQVAGALVDSSAVRELTATIASARAEVAVSHEKSRKQVYDLIEAVADVAKELAELRRELRALGDRIGK